MKADENSNDSTKSSKEHNRALFSKVKEDLGRSHRRQQWGFSGKSGEHDRSGRNADGMLLFSWGGKELYKVWLDGFEWAKRRRKRGHAREKVTPIGEGVQKEEVCCAPRWDMPCSIRRGERGGDDFSKVS